MTQFTRKSRATGITHTVDLPITQEEWDKFLGSNVLIQHAFSDLTPEQREFLISGTTQEEWDDLFGDEEEEDIYVEEEGDDT